MSDWRDRAAALSKKIDEDGRIRKEKEALRKAEQERVARQNELDTKLRILQSQFRCYVCGKLPTGPVPGYSMPGDYGSSDWVSENWDLPNNLSRCKAGNHWACIDHIHNNVCQKCAEKS